jgi:DnaJ-class molecular chaperone
MTTRLADLFTTCDRCEGTGRIREVSGGPMMRLTREGPCEACGGEGGRMTDAGKALLEFFRIARRNGHV